MSQNASTGWDVLDSAFSALRSVVHGVGPQDWGRPTPCDQWNVTQLLQHASGDQLAWASGITGGPPPAENPFTPSGHLKEAPLAVLDQALNVAVKTWATVSPDAAAVPTPFPPFPTLPASVAVGACALDAGVHAWDIAVATGQKSPLTPALAKPLYAAAIEVVEPLRAFAYAAVLEPEPGDDDTDTLLRYLGRRPDWS
jgi:uncharacterized protein (TIGR03086 family)